MGKTWDVLVALETLLKTITTFNSVSIGWEEDLFHKDKFKGKLPAVFIEYHGDAEEGPLDSSDERYVPFTAVIVIIQKAESVKQNRRDKMETATTYRDLIKDKVDDDPQLGARQVALSPLGPVRLPAPGERVPPIYWAIEIDFPMAVWEPQSDR